MHDSAGIFWNLRRLTPIVGMLVVLIWSLAPALSWELPLVFTVVVGWRIWRAWRCANPISRWLVNMSVAVGGLGWWLLFPSKLSLESAVGLLVAGVTLKLLEASQRRDAFVLVYSGFLLAVAVFLFNQSLWQSLIVLTAIALGLNGLHEASLDEISTLPVTRKLTLVGLTVLIAMPITITWFLIFPRIAPLWAIPVMADAARMGMSDTLRPGDVSRLGRDASVAFRVEFNGDQPRFDDLYWRGITLGRFNEGSWQQHNHLKQTKLGSLPPALTNGIVKSRYTVFQTASHRPWLYHLEPSTTSQSNVIGLTDGTYRTRWPITSDLSVSYELWERDATGLRLLDNDFDRELYFPVDLNPRASELVAQLMTPGDPKTTVTNVLKWYQSQPFVYTLEPSNIREPNFVDRFLFETQEGFCEHFAYSFVALMRLAGIPARIVGGYMGGELNPINNTITVREMDAHAWTEVWLDELGWIRVDPTGVVAPERIRLGSIDSLRSSASFLSESPLSLLHLNDWQWINTLRWRLDALNYRWQSNIMSYRDKQQSALLKSIIGKITPLRILMLLGATLLLTLVPLMLWFVLRGSAFFKTSQQRKLQHIDRRLRQYGVFRLEGETLRQAVKRANAASASDLATLSDAVNAFERTYYAKT